MLVFVEELWPVCFTGKTIGTFLLHSHSRAKFSLPGVSWLPFTFSPEDIFLVVGLQDLWSLHKTIQLRKLFYFYLGHSIYPWITLFLEKNGSICHFELSAYNTYDTYSISFWGLLCIKWSSAKLLIPVHFLIHWFLECVFTLAFLVWHFKLK